jgi:hypothetical protein
MITSVPDAVEKKDDSHVEENIQQEKVKSSREAGCINCGGGHIHSVRTVE